MADVPIIEPTWEFNCAHFVDFKHPYEDGNSDEWFDIDHENDGRLISANSRPLPGIKSPLKDINVHILNEANRLPAKNNNVSNNNNRKISQSKARRSYHLKTRLSAGRQMEIMRKHVTKPMKAISHYSSNSSISSKSSQAKRPENEDKEFNFADTLRQYDSPDQTKKKNRATIPVPFNFSRPEAAFNQKEKIIAFRSFAEQVIAYQNKTPARFRLKPQRPASTGGQPVTDRTEVLARSHSVKKVYIPRSPALQTKNRKRDLSIQSQQERDEEEFEKMKNYRFVAQPLRQEIFRQSYIGLPDKRVKGATIAKPFHFHVNVPARPTQTSFNLASSNFRARAIPNELFVRPLGIPRVERRRAVIAQPFSFQELDRERLKKKEEKIREIYEEEKRLREFHANPLPDLQSVKGVPEKQPKPKTMLQLFDFLANPRELHTLEKKRHAEEMERINAAFVFKAKPAQNLSPFIPQKPSRFLTCVAAPKLHTEQRAAQRENFNQNMKEREERRLAQEEKLRLEREQMESEEVAQMRASVVHKAQPIRQYKAPEKPAAREPTSPISPNVLRRRPSFRAQKDSSNP